MDLNSAIFKLKQNMTNALKRFLGTNPPKRFWHETPFIQLITLVTDEIKPNPEDILRTEQ